MRLRTWVEVDGEALKFNVKAFKRVIRGTLLAAVVKSNAYGHGLIGASRIFAKAGADWLAVDSLEEAATLREAGLTKPIVVLGYIPLADLKYIFKYKVRPVVYNMETISKLGVLAAQKKIMTPVHLKIETGMNRQGINMAKLDAFLAQFIANDYLVLEGVSTHFANIEDTTNQTYAKYQLKKFKEALSRLNYFNFKPRFVHCAASAAAFVLPESRFNLVRAGIGLYGLWPSEKTRMVFNYPKSKFLIKPALAWKTIIVQLKEVKKGSPVGYGLSERVKRDSKIAVLPVGYWDGYDRRLSSRGEVIIAGRRAKVLGRVCMNMIMVDVTNLRRSRLEQEVVLLGPGGKEEIGAQELAEICGTINYEIVARINPNIPRLYK